MHKLTNDLGEIMKQLMSNQSKEIEIIKRQRECETKITTIEYKINEIQSQKRTLEKLNA
jgi:hypothetical protein